MELDRSNNKAYETCLPAEADGLPDRRLTVMIFFSLVPFQKHV